MHNMTKTALFVVFAVLFPLLVVPIGWLVRRVFDPLRLARPEPSLTTYLALSHPQSSPKDKSQ
jgi:hypothetical protein